MKIYQVIAMFDYPEINRSARVMAIDPHQAILRAVLGQKIPVCFRRDCNGDLQASYWQDISAELANPWPQIEKHHRLKWRTRAQLHQLRFDVIEIS